MAPLPHNRLGIAVLSSCAAGTVVDAVFIGLRLWGRRLKKKRWVLSDSLIVAAWILILADFIRRIIGYKLGIGLHIDQIIAAQGTTHLEDILKLTYAGNFLWITTATLIKISILLIYLELFFCITWFLWAIRITMGLAIAFFLVTFVGSMTTCKPFDANWNPTLPGAHCSMTQGDAYVFSGAWNLGMDVILVLMPIPAVWSLNISKRKRVAISAMFGLGFLIIFVVAFRFKLIPHRDLYDIVHDGEIPGLLTQLEVYLGLISACLPFLSPALREMGSTVAKTKAFKYVVSRSGSSDGTDKGSSEGTNSYNVLGETLGNGSSNGVIAGHDARYKRSDEEIMIDDKYNVPYMEPWTEDKAATVSVNEIRMTSGWDVHVEKRV